MKPEIAKVFGELSGLPRDVRERYYEQHSIGDSIREEVESLLAWDDGAPISKLVHSAVELAFREPARGGDFCGPFRLLHVIGRGGMGVVYLAEREDGQVRQKVAVKFLRTSSDSPATRQRFLQERQILARLDHPNIARLIDAGHRDDGQPWLAMELVEGRPIDEHCRDLSTRQKVELMATVCEAIASAHQKLVVHRDLKPGNILVDAEGRPRVLDFGIARLMDGAEATATVERRLTPEYASPEQIANAPASTSSDIYSLGAVLFRLLTEELPPRTTAPVPRRTGATSDADLDAIVSKAIRYEAHERYASADKLADDLRAWLHHRPITARQGERWYHARRWFRRYWPLALATVIAATGLTAGLIVARRERDEARQRFNDVRKLAAQFFAVERDIRFLSGAVPARERIVNTSLAYLEDLSKRAGDDWHLKQEIAAGYRAAASVQGLEGGFSLGHRAEAEQSLRKAANLLREAVIAAPAERSLQHDQIELLEMQLRSHIAAGDDTSEPDLKRLGSLVGVWASGPRFGPADWAFAARVYETMSQGARNAGRLSDAVAFAQAAIALSRKAAQHDGTEFNRNAYVLALQRYGITRRLTGDLEGAISAWTEALELATKMAGEKPDNLSWTINISVTEALIGRALFDAEGPSLRRPDDAARHFETSLRLSRQAMLKNPDEFQIRMNHAISAWRYGNALRGGNPRRATESYDEAIAILRPAKPGLTRAIALTGALADSGAPLRALGRGAEAASRLREAEGICEGYSKSMQTFEGCRDILAAAEASAAMAAGRPKDAVAAHRAWLSLRPEADRQPEVEKDLLEAFSVAVHYQGLRNALLALDRKDEAAVTDERLRSIVNFWKRQSKSGADALSIP